jgi:hypothetical protein
MTPFMRRWASSRESQWKARCPKFRELAQRRSPPASGNEFQIVQAAVPDGWRENVPMILIERWRRVSEMSGMNLGVKAPGRALRALPLY